MTWQAPAYETPTASMKALGEGLLQEGKVGCIILAGGMGSRWGEDAPKGTIPMEIFEGRALFEVLLTRAKRSGSLCPIAIMTSEATHDKTVAYFEKHAMFGMEVAFFKQEQLPFLDDAGLSIEGSFGPSGNGEVFSAFCKSHLWQDTGIVYVHIIAVDNVLADPFDPYACGVLALREGDLAIKSIIKEDPEELLGILVAEAGGIRVIEYSEMPEGCDFVGFPAYTGLICASMEFIKRAALLDLPYHLARKRWKQNWAWKRERFIFDSFVYAQRPCVLLYPRHQVYAPLKDKKDALAQEAARLGFLSLKDKL